MVGDGLDAIGGALERLLAGGFDLICVTGGLGPTHDDLTMEAVARVTGRPLRLERGGARDGAGAEPRGVPARPTSSAAVQEKQATLPEGARVLPPPGTAPGLRAGPRGHRHRGAARARRGSSRGCGRRRCPRSPSPACSPARAAAARARAAAVGGPGVAADRGARRVRPGRLGAPARGHLRPRGGAGGDGPGPARRTRGRPTRWRSGSRERLPDELFSRDGAHDRRGGGRGPARAPARPSRSPSRAPAGCSARGSPSGPGRPRTSSAG